MPVLACRGDIHQVVTRYQSGPLAHHGVTLWSVSDGVAVVIQVKRPLTPSLSLTDVCADEGIGAPNRLGGDVAVG